MRLITTSLVVLFLIAGCNLFSPIDPGGSSLDKCKSLNDEKSYEDAIKACEDAVKEDPKNIEAQLELADVNLAAIGVNIKELSDIFLNSSAGTVSITQLAEGLIAVGNINMANAVISKLHAKEAITAFDAYGALLISQGVTNANQVATFYGVLARVCYVSVLMAYADLGPNGNHDGLIDKMDICSTAPCLVPGTICMNDYSTPWGPCGGMDNGDALEAAATIYSIKDELKTLGLGKLQQTVDAMASKVFPIPTNTVPPISFTSGSILDIFTNPAYNPFEADAGREILREISR